MGVAEPAQLVVVGLKVAVYQQSVDAYTDGVLANEGNFVFYLILNHLKQRVDRQG